MGTGLVSISAAVRSAVASGYCSLLNSDSLRLTLGTHRTKSEYTKIKSEGQQGGHIVTSDVLLFQKERKDTASSKRLYSSVFHLIMKGQ